MVTPSQFRSGAIIMLDMHCLFCKRCCGQHLEAMWKDHWDNTFGCEHCGLALYFPILVRHSTHKRLGVDLALLCLLPRITPARVVIRRDTYRGQAPQMIDYKGLRSAPRHDVPAIEARAIDQFSSI